jgi:penicillin-binding protein 1C
VRHHRPETEPTTSLNHDRSQVSPAAAPRAHEQKAAPGAAPRGRRSKVAPVAAWRHHRLRVAVSAALLGAAIITVGVFVAAFLTPVPMARLSVPASTLVYDSQSGLMAAFLAPDDRWRVNVSLDEVSDEFIRMLLSYEDRWFFRHLGVNPLAMCRAIIQNLRTGSIVSGGSTLTMQVARLLDPKPRTIASKVIEIFQAISLELRYSKSDILQMYLNLAPYGGNVEGIGAASLLYFGKCPAELSTGEAALLVALPKAPESLRPDRFSDAAKAARDEVLRRAVRFGAIDEASCIEALSEPPPTGRRELPLVAPHFTRLMAQQYGPGRINTTISPNIQTEVQRMLAQHVARLKEDGITNGSVVVIDNLNRSIVAYVGSADFYDAAASGQVDGARAQRSPGSALKPFIYAIAFDRGIITPRFYLEDVPVSYGDYSPQNYSGTHSGLVSAESALSQSLNVPAVNLLAEIGVDSFCNFLRDAGISSLSKSRAYGLSLAIGGCEVTLLELTTAYSALASGGLLRPPFMVTSAASTSPPTDAPPAAASAATSAGAEVRPALRLLSPDSAFLVTEILSNNARPDFPPGWESTSLPRVAWKTGTSYGHRDAWSIGYSPRYTVGVWIGNFSGKASSKLVGAEAAAPLLFQIMNRLLEGTETEWFRLPETLLKRAVCSLSGMPVGPNCPVAVQDYSIAGKSSERVCDLHRTTLIDESTGLRVPDYLRGTDGVAERTYIEWPPAVASWMTATEATGYRPPPLDSRFARKISGDPPRIVSPIRGREYELRPAVPADQQKVALIAEAGSGIRQLYWFIDGEFVGSAAPGEAVFYTPTYGTHELVCQDELGRTARLSVVISAPL